MPPATSSVTTASSISSSDISLPSSPSASPEASPDPYAFSSSDEAADAAPPAKKMKPGGATPGVRTWPTADEVVLLEAVAAHKEQHGGRLPNRAELAAALGGRLPQYTAEQVSKRVHALRARYDQSVRNLRRGTVPVTDDDVRVFRLSKRIWEGVPKRTRPRAAPHPERREFAEMEAAYPCLAATVEAVAAESAAGRALRMAFGRIGDEQAAELEAKLRRQHVAEMKAEARRAELSSMVARAFVGAMDSE